MGIISKLTSPAATYIAFGAKHGLDWLYDNSISSSIPEPLGVGIAIAAYVGRQRDSDVIRLASAAALGYLTWHYGSEAADLWSSGADYTRMMTDGWFALQTTREFAKALWKPWHKE